MKSHQDTFRMESAFPSWTQVAQQCGPRSSSTPHCAWPSCPPHRPSALFPRRPRAAPSPLAPPARLPSRGRAEVAGGALLPRTCPATPRARCPTSAAACRTSPPPIAATAPPIQPSQSRYGHPLCVDWCMSRCWCCGGSKARYKSCRAGGAERGGLRGSHRPSLPPPNRANPTSPTSARVVAVHRMPHEQQSPRLEQHV